jgi:hypothetical protein
LVEDKNIEPEHMTGSQAGKKLGLLQWCHAKGKAPHIGRKAAIALACMARGRAKTKHPSREQNRLKKRQKKPLQKVAISRCRSRCRSRYRSRSRYRHRYRRRCRCRSHSHCRIKKLIEGQSQHGCHYHAHYRCR